MTHRPSPAAALLAAALASLASLAACGGADDSNDARERQMEQAAADRGLDVDVEIDDRNGEEQLVIRGLGQGGDTKIGRNLDVPDDFPDDMPVYPGLTLHAAGKTGPGYSLQGQTADGVDQIAQFYQQQMGEQGWQAEGETAAGPAMRMLRFSKDQRSAGITLIEGDNATTVQLSILSLGG